MNIVDNSLQLVNAESTVAVQDPDTNFFTKVVFGLSTAVTLFPSEVENKTVAEIIAAAAKRGNMLLPSNYTVIKTGSGIVTGDCVQEGNSDYKVVFSSGKGG